MGKIFNEPGSGTTTTLEDNHSAIAYSLNALVSEKTKLVDLKGHFLKDHVQQGTISLRYLPTDRMVTDMFRKSMPRHAPARHRSAILGGADPMQRFIM
jgi:KUP system potassium uptake protein